MCSVRILRKDQYHDEREEGPGQPPERPDEHRPQDAQGKAAVRLNAVKHGLLSQEILLPGEDGEALRELVERLRDELQPAGELETLLVDRIVFDYWRLWRLGRVEAGIFVWQHYGELAKRARREAGRHTKQEGKVVEIIDSERPTTTITDQKKYDEAISDAEVMEALQEGETATLGQTFVRDAGTANAFSKLSRYETAIENRFYKALHELQRRQAARRAYGNGTPPAAMDVDATGVSRELN